MLEEATGFVIGMDCFLSLLTPHLPQIVSLFFPLECSDARSSVGLRLV